MGPIESNNFLASPCEQDPVASVASTEEEALHHKPIRTEALLDLMGWVYLIDGGIGCVAAFLVGLPALLAMHTAEDPDSIFHWIVGACGVGLVSGWQMWTGHKLRELDPRARHSAIILSTLGLFLVPVGSFISLFFLCLISSAKGEFVLSEEYASLRQTTPEAEQGTSLLAWMFILLVIPFQSFGWVATTFFGR
jgi:hypothetical protein